MKRSLPLYPGKLKLIAKTQSARDETLEITSYLLFSECIILREREIFSWEKRKNSLFLLQLPPSSLFLHFSESFKTFSSLISSVCLSAALSRSRKLSYYPFFAKLLVPALSPDSGSSNILSCLSLVLMIHLRLACLKSGTMLMPKSRDGPSKILMENVIDYFPSPLPDFFIFIFIVFKLLFHFFFLLYPPLCIVRL